jgi:hypothetical protein
MLDNINTLAGQFESKEELQKYCDNQFLTIQRLVTQVKRLEEELYDTKSLLTAAVPMENKVQLDVAPEQLICEMQIKKLEKVSMERDLTLEETKKLDLLVKNLLLIKEDKKGIKEAEFNKVEDISEAQLLSLVTAPETKE